MALVRHFEGKKYIFRDMTRSEGELEILRTLYKGQGLSVRVVTKGKAHYIYTRQKDD